MDDDTDPQGPPPPVDGNTQRRSNSGPGPGEPTRAELLARVAYLEEKLTTLPAIEQTKGALMLTYGISADAAFNLLRFHSQNRNVKVRAIAAQLTTLMCSSPTTTAAITRFDRLLDDVARSLRPTLMPTTTDQDARASATSTATALWPRIPSVELSEVMLRAVATAPPGITIAGNALDMPLVYANDAFTEMTGYSIDEILGRNCRFLQGAETNRKDVGELSRAIHEGRDFSVVMRNYRSDGTPFWNEVSVSPISDRTGQITHYIGTQIDITERMNRQDTAGSKAQ